MASDKDALYSRAQKHIQKGQWLKAIELMEEVHLLDRDDAVVTLRLGDLYKKVGSSDQAAEYYFKTANIYADTGQKTKAAAIYKMLLRTNPSHEEAQQRLDGLTAKQETVNISATSSPAVFTSSFTDAQTGETSQDPDNILPSAVKPAPMDVFYGSSEQASRDDEPEVKTELVPGLVELGSTVGHLEFDMLEKVTPVESQRTVDISDEKPGTGIESFAMNKEASRREPVEAAGAANDFDEALPPSGIDIFSDFASDAAVPSDPASAAPSRQASRPPRRDIEFLTDLEEDELWELLGRMDRQTYGPEEFIIREGDAGDSMYIITSGRVLVTTTKNSMRIRLAELGENDFFGEVSFLTGQPRTADVTAIETTTLMVFSRSEMDELINKYPSVEKVLRMFQKDRVADTMSTIMTLSEGML